MASRYKSKTSYAAKKEFNWGRFFQLLPIYLTLGLMPFLLRVIQYEHRLGDFPWYYASTDIYQVDTYLVFRQWWFTAITIYMFLVILFRYLDNKKFFRCSMLCIPLGVFAVFSLLSAVFSEYKHFAFLGGFEQFENVFVLIGYALIVYYAFLVIESDKEVRSILNVLTFSTLALGIIGTLQTFGYNVLLSEFVNALIVPAGVNAELQVTEGLSQVIMTLYNPNYVGVYVAMLFPLYAVLLMFSKKRKEQLIYLLVLVLLLISLYGCGSRAAILVLAFEIGVLVLFMWRTILKRWYIVLATAVALIALFLIVNKINDNVFINRIVQALSTGKTTYALESIETMDDGVHVCYKGNELILKFGQTNSAGFSFDMTDAAGERISLRMKEDGYTYLMNDPRFEGFEISVANYPVGPCLELVIDGQIWRFANPDDGTGYYYLTEKGKLDKLHMAEQVLFSDYEQILSKRGYIWSVSIPLLKKHIVFGSGADTFVTEFPQQDYLRLVRNEFHPQIMSKPHSLYLQVGVQDGVIAMLGLIVFFAMYLVQCIKLYFFSKFESDYEKIGVAIMFAVLGFTIMGISNDSSVTVSPIFWAIAGLGTYINHQVSLQKKESKEAGK